MINRHLLTTLFSVLVGLFGPMLVLASAQMVPLAILLALTSAAVLYASRPVDVRADPTLLFAAILCVGYLVLADFWTPLGDNAERALRAGLLLVCAVLSWSAVNRLDRAEKARCTKALLAGVIFALLWLAIEKLSGNWLLRQLSDKPNLDWWWGAYNRALNVLSMTGPVLVLLFWRRSRAAALGAGLAPFLAGIALGASASAILAGGAGLIAMLLAAWRPKFALALLAAGLFGIALFGPALVRDADRIAPAIDLAVDHGSFSFQHRLIVWHFTASRIAERPMFGWGARSARDLPDAELDIYSYTDRIGAPWSPLLVTSSLESADVMPLHPHNALLQARLELGLVGTVLFLATIVGALHRGVSGPARGQAAALMGVVAAAACVWCLSVGLWQSWWIASVGVAVVLTRLVPDEIGQK